MGMKNHEKSTKKKQNVETNGGEKPLGNQKKNKKIKMWRPMVGSRAIGLHILFFAFLWNSKLFLIPIGLHIYIYILFPQ